MQSVNGTQNNVESTKKIKYCKKCLTGKRYANLTICFHCHCKAQKEKRIEKLAKELERKKKRREKEANSPAVLKDTLDTLVSQYVRRRASDWKGMATCITCGVMKHYKELQAGHYVSRDNYSVRYDLRNVHVQCFRCNMKLKGCKSGNLVKYTKYLLNNYGADWLQKLIKDGEKIKQWTPSELKELIAQYQSLIISL